MQSPRVVHPPSTAAAATGLTSVLVVPAPPTADSTAAIGNSGDHQSAPYLRQSHSGSLPGSVPLLHGSAGNVSRDGLNYASGTDCLSRGHPRYTRPLTVTYPTDDSTVNQGGYPHFMAAGGDRRNWDTGPSLRSWSDHHQISPETSGLTVLDSMGHKRRRLRIPGPTGEDGGVIFTTIITDGGETADNASMTGSDIYGALGPSGTSDESVTPYVRVTASDSGLQLQHRRANIVSGCRGTSFQRGPNGPASLGARNMDGLSISAAAPVDHHYRDSVNQQSFLQVDGYRGNVNAGIPAPPAFADVCRLGGENVNNPGISVFDRAAHTTATPPPTHTASGARPPRPYYRPRGYPAPDGSLPSRPPSLSPPPYSAREQPPPPSGCTSSSSRRLPPSSAAAVGAALSPSASATAAYHYPQSIRTDGIRPVLDGQTWAPPSHSCCPHPPALFNHLTASSLSSVTHPSLVVKSHPPPPPRISENSFLTSPVYSPSPPVPAARASGRLGLVLSVPPPPREVDSHGVISPGHLAILPLQRGSGLTPSTSTIPHENDAVRCGNARMMENDNLATAYRNPPSAAAAAGVSIIPVSATLKPAAPPALLPRPRNCASIVEHPPNSLSPGSSTTASSAVITERVSMAEEPGKQASERASFAGSTTANETRQRARTNVSIFAADTTSAGAVLDSSGADCGAIVVPPPDIAAMLDDPPAPKPSAVSPLPVGAPPQSTLTTTSAADLPSSNLSGASSEDLLTSEATMPPNTERTASGGSQTTKSFDRLSVPTNDTTPIRSPEDETPRDAEELQQPYKTPMPSDSIRCRRSVRLQRNRKRRVVHSPADLFAAETPANGSEEATPTEGTRTKCHTVSTASAEDALRTEHRAVSHRPHTATIAGARVAGESSYEGASDDDRPSSAKMHAWRRQLDAAKAWPALPRQSLSAGETEVIPSPPYALRSKATRRSAVRHVAAVSHTPTARRQGSSRRPSKQGKKRGTSSLISTTIAAPRHSSPVAASLPALKQQPPVSPRETNNQQIPRNAGPASSPAGSPEHQSELVLLDPRPIGIESSPTWDRLETGVPREDGMEENYTLSAAEDGSGAPFLSPDGEFARLIAHYWPRGYSSQKERAKLSSRTLAMSGPLSDPSICRLLASLPVVLTPPPLFTQEAAGVIQYVQSGIAKIFLHSEMSSEQRCSNMANFFDQLAEVYRSSSASNKEILASDSGALQHSDKQAFERFHEASTLLRVSDFVNDCLDVHPDLDQDSERSGNPAAIAAFRDGWFPGASSMFDFNCPTALWQPLSHANMSQYPTGFGQPVDQSKRGSTFEQPFTGTIATPAGLPRSTRKRFRPCSSSGNLNVVPADHHPLTVGTGGGGGGQLWDGPGHLGPPSWVFPQSFYLDRDGDDEGSSGPSNGHGRRAGGKKSGSSGRKTPAPTKGSAFDEQSVDGADSLAGGAESGQSTSSSSSRRSTDRLNAAATPLTDPAPSSRAGRDLSDEETTAINQIQHEYRIQAKQRRIVSRWQRRSYRTQDDLHDDVAAQPWSPSFLAAPPSSPHDPTLITEVVNATAVDSTAQSGASATLASQSTRQINPQDEAATTPPAHITARASHRLSSQFTDVRQMPSSTTTSNLPFLSSDEIATAAFSLLRSAAPRDPANIPDCASRSPNVPTEYGFSRQQQSPFGTAMIDHAGGLVQAGAEPESLRVPSPTAFSPATDKLFPTSTSRPIASRMPNDTGLVATSKPSGPSCDMSPLAFVPARANNTGLFIHPHYKLAAAALQADRFSTAEILDSLSGHNPKSAAAIIAAAAAARIALAGGQSDMLAAAATATASTSTDPMGTASTPTTTTSATGGCGVPLSQGSNNGSSSAPKAKVAIQESLTTSSLPVPVGAAPMARHARPPPQHLRQLGSRASDPGGAAGAVHSDDRKSLRIVSSTAATSAGSDGAGPVSGSSTTASSAAGAVGTPFGIRPAGLPTTRRHRLSSEYKQRSVYWIDSIKRVSGWHPYVWYLMCRRPELEALGVKARQVARVAGREWESLQNQEEKLTAFLMSTVEFIAQYPVPVKECKEVTKEYRYFLSHELQTPNKGVFTPAVNDALAEIANGALEASPGSNSGRGTGGMPSTMGIPPKVEPPSFSAPRTSRTAAGCSPVDIARVKFAATAPFPFPPGAVAHIRRLSTLPPPPPVSDDPFTLVAAAVAATQASSPRTKAEASAAHRDLGATGVAVTYNRPTLPADMSSRSTATQAIVVPCPTATESESGTGEFGMGGRDQPVGQVGRLACSGKTDLVDTAAPGIPATGSSFASARDIAVNTSTAARAMSVERRDESPLPINASLDVAEGPEIATVMIKSTGPRSADTTGG